MRTYLVDIDVVKGLSWIAMFATIASMKKCKVVTITSIQNKTGFLNFPNFDNFPSDCQWIWGCSSINILKLCTSFCPESQEYIDYIDGLSKDCSNSSVLAMELPQSCTKLSNYEKLSMHLLYENLWYVGCHSHINFHIINALTILLLVYLTNLSHWPLRDVAVILTHWSQDKMAAILQTCSNSFSWMKMFNFGFKFHWSLFQGVQLTISQHWFGWWLGAKKVTSHYLNQRWSSLMTHLCVLWPQLVKSVISILI